MELDARGASAALLWLRSSDCNMLSRATQLRHWAVIKVTRNMLEAHARTCTGEHTACAQDASGDAPVLDQHRHLTVPGDCDQSKPANMSLVSKMHTVSVQKESTNASWVAQEELAKQVRALPAELIISTTRLPRQWNCAHLQAMMPPSGSCHASTTRYSPS